MNHPASHHQPTVSSTSFDDQQRRLRSVARERRTGKHVKPEERAKEPPADRGKEIPLGAVHVDAKGIVLEHRPREKDDEVRPEDIVGRHITAIAPWASSAIFMGGLKSTVESRKVSLHFDFKTSAHSAERIIHVNILAVGDRTAWVFISDKTIPVLA